MYQKGSNCSPSGWHSTRKRRDDERKDQAKDTVEKISNEFEAAEDNEAPDGNERVHRRVRFLSNFSSSF